MGAPEAPRPSTFSAPPDRPQHSRNCSNPPQLGSIVREHCITNGAWGIVTCPPLPVDACEFSLWALEKNHFHLRAIVEGASYRATRDKTLPAHQDQPEEGADGPHALVLFQDEVKVSLGADPGGNPRAARVAGCTAAAAPKSL